MDSWYRAPCRSRQDTCAMHAIIIILFCSVHNHMHLSMIPAAISPHSTSVAEGAIPRSLSIPLLSAQGAYLLRSVQSPVAYCH